MSSLKVMILCGRSPRHLHFANVLTKNSHVVAIVQEVGRQWTLKNVLRRSRPSALVHRLSRSLRDWRKYSDGSEARFFFGDAAPRLLRNDLLTEVPYINHPSVIAIANRSAPDLVAVFGTSLLRGATLSLGRLGIVNLHGGLSPEYRGADCTFWALYNNEPEKVGCTLHFIDAGIDTGRLIAHVQPEVHADDDELTLFYRGVRDSSLAFVELLERLERGERFGRPQPNRGRLYQVKQRRWKHDKDLARRLKAGMLQHVQLPARVTWFPAA